MKSETDELNLAILALEKKREQELILLKEQMNSSFDTLKPINLIKSTFAEISSSPEIKENILNSSVGIGSGVIAKKIFIGGSKNRLKFVAGTLLQFAITNVVSKHAGDIKSVGKVLLSAFLKRRKESKAEFNRHDEHG